MNRNRALLKYIGSRLAITPLMLWLISTLVFILLRIAPGDPVDAILGTRGNDVAREILRTKLGLNKPLINQYLNFLGNIFHGNLGESLNTQEPVIEIISRALPATIELGLFSLLISLIIGFAIGFSGIYKPNGKIDFISRFYGIGTYALPPFWAAMISQIIFSVILRWFPIGGRFPPQLLQPESNFILFYSLFHGNWENLIGAFKHIFLPACTLGILLSGIFSRSLRINLDKALETNYVEAAKSRGLSYYNIIINHALPNALLPILTILGLTISSLIGGTLLIEITFSWPGIALALQEGISQRDYTLVQGIVVIVASLVVIISVVIDILIALIDPRVQY